MLVPLAQDMHSRMTQHSLWNRTGIMGYIIPPILVNLEIDGSFLTLRPLLLFLSFFV